MGKIYISQLFPEERVNKILNKYDIGLEIIEFGIGYTLDKDDNGIVEYYKRNGELIKNRSLSIHGPFLDLNTASFDNMIKQATLTRYNQAYSVAKRLGADRIVFHSCYYDDVYFKDVYINNSLEFWNEFLIDKDDFLIGRNIDSVNGYIENQDVISKIHARIIRVGNNFFIKDEESLNGTYLNDKKINEYDVRPLKIGDIVKLANIEFKIK